MTTEMPLNCYPFTPFRSIREQRAPAPAVRTDPSHRHSPVSVLLAALMTFRVASATEREVTVDVQTVEPQAVTGRLISFSLRDGAVVLTDHLAPSLTGLGADHAEKRQIPTADIIRMTKHFSSAQDALTEATGRPDGSSPRGSTVAGLTPAAHMSDQWTITLTWGDVLWGRVIGARGETVVIETADLGEVPIPLDAMAGIVSARAASSLHRESLHWLDRGSAERPVSRSAGGTSALGRRGAESVRAMSETEDDRVLLTNGDVLRGFISAMDADGIAIDTGTGPTTAPYRLVVGARLAHAVPAMTPQPYLILTLRDGGKLTATVLDWSDAGVSARLRAGVAVQVDADRIVAVEVIGGRWEWLSEHRPVSYEQAPMLGPGWEFQAGRSVLGGPILVAGETYERGIGVHSRSNLVFELNGKYREFVTSFGMDDDSGPFADASVVVLVDGQRRFEKAHVRRGSLFGPARVDVSHAGRIELIVEYGDNGDMQDRFDWVEPGLIR